MRTGHQIGETPPLEFPNDGGTDHAAVASYKD
jgi:hypothetical protein